MKKHTKYLLKIHCYSFPQNISKYVLKNVLAIEAEILQKQLVKSNNNVTDQQSLSTISHRNLLACPQMRSTKEHSNIFSATLFLYRLLLWLTIKEISSRIIHLISMHSFSEEYEFLLPDAHTYMWGKTCKNSWGK